jgi:hypothetical protein
MATFQPYEQGGIVGPKQKGIIELLQGGDAGPTLQGPAPVPGANDFPGAGDASPSAAPVSPAYSKVAPSGWDQTKWDDPSHNDAKYAMRKTLDPFNAQQGFTPEAIAALNALGYGTFSGNGQHLSLSGLTDKGRQAKLSGDYQGADFINSYQNGANPGATWGYKDPVAEAAQAQSQPHGGGMPSFGGSNINGMLQSDAQGNIQQALAGLQQPGMLQQLIAALQGGR